MGCGTRQEPWHGAAKLFCRRDQAFFWRTTGDCLLSGSRQPCLQSRNRRDAMAGVCPGCLRATGGRAVASGGSSPNFIWPQHGAPSVWPLPYSARTLLLFRSLLCYPGFFYAPLWFGGRARLTLLFMVCRARLRLCFAVPRRPANRRKQARTGADRRKQARQAQTGATGADRRRQARTGAGRRGQARAGAF